MAVILSGRAQSDFTTTFSASQNFTQGVGSSGWTGAYGGNNTSSTFQSGSGQLTVTDTGGHWENGGNSGHLLYLTYSGDFTMEAKLASLTDPTYATAGIGAFDPSVTTGSPTVTWIGAYDKSFYKGGTLGTRTIVNGSMVDNEGAVTGINGDLPVWFEMTRYGDVFTEYYSFDGVTFTELNSVTMTTLPNTLDVGIWDGSFSGNTITAVFDSFSIAPAPEPGTLALAGLGLTLLAAVRRRI